MTTTTDPRPTLRQLTATVAYRAAKVLRDVPANFSSRRFGEGTRTPVEILAHLGDLTEWAVTVAEGGYTWRAGGSKDWEGERARFFRNLAALDHALAGEAEFKGSMEKLVQGPLADALTHIGQIAMLRGMAGIAVRPESYARAAITAGRVGPDQAEPLAEFLGDASAR